MPNAKTLFITTVLLCSNLYGEAIALLIKTDGKVTFKRLGSSIFSERATLGTAINNGDALRVGEQSFAAVMYLDDKTVLKIRENSEFEFLDTRNTRTIDMERGTILNEIESSIKVRSSDSQRETSILVPPMSTPIYQGDVIRSFNAKLTDAKTRGSFQSALW